MFRVINFSRLSSFLLSPPSVSSFVSPFACYFDLYLLSSLPSFSLSQNNYSMFLFRSTNFVIHIYIFLVCRLFCFHFLPVHCNFFFLLYTFSIFSFFPFFLPSPFTFFPFLVFSSFLFFSFTMSVSYVVASFSVIHFLYFRVSLFLFLYVSECSILYSYSSLSRHIPEWIFAAVCVSCSEDASIFSFFSFFFLFILVPIFSFKI